MISSLFGASFDRRVGSKFVSQGKYLPTSIRAKLLYAKPVPWSGDWEAPSGDWEAVTGDTDYSAHKLPGKTEPSYAAVYAAVNDGSGFWYDGNGDPVARLVSEILAEIRTNTWNIWCSNHGRLMIFAKTLLYSEAAVVERYLLGIRPPVNAPPTLSDVVLHYDADKSELLELTGGASPLNYNVLSPQYERQADGSYVNVGARPAVDTLEDGFVGLRSCGQVQNLLPGDASVARSVTLTAQIYTLQVFGSGSASCSYGTATENYPLTFTATAGTTTFTPSGASAWMLRAMPYPLAIYVPPGITQPASNATATGGTWFTNPLDSDLWKALTGSPLTLATRIKIGVGSGDIGNSVYLRLFDCDVTLSRVVYVGRSSGGVLYPSRSYDGVNFAELTGGSWSRNSVIRQFVQVNTAGTRFRVGYMIEGTHTAIQWSHPSNDSNTWAVFDGSFNPSNLYRLMIGYLTPQPIWFNKITAWNRQVPDDELAVAWL